jgi:hypothetical protein
MPSRYIRSNIVRDNSEYYEPIRRGNKTLIHYETMPMRNPTIKERASVSTTTHIWSYGDRYYKLAQTYYADTRFWWVIAWWNGAPCEANLAAGHPLRIPLDLEKALRILEG